MRERLRAIAAEVFGLPVSELPGEVASHELEAWDSLRHLELMLAVEMEFETQISSEAMPTLLSLELIEEYLREQGVPARL